MKHLRLTMKRPNPEKLAAEATKWNLAHPVGTPVMRYKLIAPLREGAETKTRSAAYVMGGHSVMVMVEGVSGGVLLESLKPIGIRPDISAAGHTYSAGYKTGKGIIATASAK